MEVKTKNKWYELRHSFVVLIVNIFSLCASSSHIDYEILSVWICNWKWMWYAHMFPYFQIILSKLHDATSQFNWGTCVK